MIHQFLPSSCFWSPSERPIAQLKRENLEFSRPSLFWNITQYWHQDCLFFLGSLAFKSRWDSFPSVDQRGTKRSRSSQNIGKIHHVSNKNHKNSRATFVTYKCCSHVFWECLAKYKAHNQSRSISKLLPKVRY